MIRRVLAAAVLGAALFLAACSETPAATPGPSSAPTSAVAAGTTGDKTACETFSAAAAAMGGQMQGSMADLTAAMGGDEAKLKAAMVVFAKAYSDFAAGIQTAKGQATGPELKEAFGKMATIVEAGAAMFTDPKAAQDSTAVLAALNNPELTAAQQTVLTQCGAYLK